MSSSFPWIELQDDVIRGRTRLTRRMVERRIADSVHILPLHSGGLRELENAIMDSPLKTSNRGYPLQFRDESKIALMRGKMVELNDFLLALHDWLGERWDVVTT